MNGDCALQAPTQCVILVGGLGSRLGSLTATCPKPLLPVGGKPFLDTLMWHACRFGFRRVLLLAGFGANLVRHYIAHSPWRDRLEIEVLSESSPLGTAGALRKAASKLDDTFMLLNGDSVFDFNWLDLGDLLKEPFLGAVALRRVADASRFGIAELVGNKVTTFGERGTRSGGLINSGVYYMSRELAWLCPEQGSIEGDVLPELALSGRIAGRTYTGFFHDIGVPDAYEAADKLVPVSLQRPAIFFDRDGVINVDHGYVGDISRFEWVPCAKEAIKYANDRGFLTFLVTNQAGIARGYYSENSVRVLHEAIQHELRIHGAHIDDIRYCPHHPEGSVSHLAVPCSCRKPAPGMITELIANWPVDISQSLLIGDKATDIEAGENAGIKSLLFEGKNLDAFLRRALKEQDGI